MGCSHSVPIAPIEEILYESTNNTLDRELDKLDTQVTRYISGDVQEIYFNNTDFETNISFLLERYNKKNRKINEIFTAKFVEIKNNAFAFYPSINNEILISKIYNSELFTTTICKNLLLDKNYNIDIVNIDDIKINIDIGFDALIKLRVDKREYLIDLEIDIDGFKYIRKIEISECNNNCIFMNNIISFKEFIISIFYLTRDYITCQVSESVINLISKYIEYHENKYPEINIVYNPICIYTGSKYSKYNNMYFILDLSYKNYLRLILEHDTQIIELSELNNIKFILLCKTHVQYVLSLYKNIFNDYASKYETSSFEFYCQDDALCRREIKKSIMEMLMGFGVPYVLKCVLLSDETKYYKFCFRFVHKI